VTARRAAVALAVACCCLAATGAARAKTKKREHHHHHHHHEHKSHGHQADEGPTAEGKAHLKRANELAGDGDCAAAIGEYTKAYDLLADPVVLFNRAECFRRLGAGDHAADDYHAFLEKVPNAPNRADIEAKIVALEAPEPPAREKPAETAPPPAPPPPPKEPEARAPPPVAPAPPPTPVAAPSPPKPEPVVAVQHPAVSDDAGPAHGTRPWVWVALAVLVVGAGVGGYFMLRPRQEPPPESALGNYRF
jgi:tetratricopeptide (TPR) repeat protein